MKSVRISSIKCFANKSKAKGQIIDKKIVNKMNIGDTFDFESSNFQCCDNSDCQCCVCVNNSFFEKAKIYENR